MRLNLYTWFDGETSLMNIRVVRKTEKGKKGKMGARLPV
jgi:hypothetical protein